MEEQQTKQSRQACIESLRRQIKEGTYQVNASDLAEAIIKHLQNKQQQAA